MAPARPPLSVRELRLGALGRALLSWFDDHQRDLPWRRTRDPYAIWVSEVMLQQTQVRTVIPYYERWLARFPTISALADADEQAVLRQWQGLGYYSRARRLLVGARAVRDRHAGRVPACAAALRELPGVGPYSAGAIASIAFDLPEPMVDGNVVRVLTRLFGLHGDPGRAPLKRRLWELSKSLLPEKRPGAFNQALMELGATVCTPKRPACASCPVRRFCAARKLGQPERFPEAKRRAKATPVRTVLVIATRRDRLLMVQLANSAPRWGGMWGFPMMEVSETESLDTAARRALADTVGLVPRSIRSLGTARHSVTRYRLTLEAAWSDNPGGRARAQHCAALRWARPSELAELPIPTVFRKVLGLGFRDPHFSEFFRQPRRVRA